MKTKIAFIIAALSIAGCNTMQGLGEDIKKGGSALSETAEDVKTGGSKKADDDKK